MQVICNQLGDPRLRVALNEMTGGIDLFVDEAGGIRLSFPLDVCEVHGLIGAIKNLLEWDDKTGTMQDEH